jgi:hypothetical protein
MKKYNHRNVLDRAQRRFLRARPGSVLILVVALLILMAIIGTAYMSMAQGDRTTAAIHTNNTEIDMLLDGVVNMMKGSILGELYSGGTFRNGQRTVANAGYNNWNGVGLDSSSTDVIQSPGGTYVASRTPEVPALGGAPARGSNDPFWPFITAPISGTQFTSPYWNPTRATAAPFLAGMGKIAPLDPYHYTQRDSYRAPLGAYPNGLIPGYIQVPANTGPWYPAWVDSAHPGDPNYAILAADTDGDGVADAGYFKLPIGAINGVTYYAAVRVIDNNAAVNVNTAGWPDSTTSDTAPFLMGDYFPTSIYLQRMLHPKDSLVVDPAPYKSLYTYRTNGVVGPHAPIDDLGFNRVDYIFVPDLKSNAILTLPPGLDCTWNQLGRRLDNPSPIGAGVSGALYYQSLSISESISFARNFVLRTSSSSPSFLETALPYTTFNFSAQSPYTATDQITANSLASAWFGDNFNYFSNAPDRLAPDITNPNLNVQTESARALLVARNPVTNFAPNKFNRVIAGNIAPTVGFGDQVELNGRAYVYIGPPLVNPAAQPLVVSPIGVPTFLPFPTTVNPAYNTSLYWVPEPWADTPTKVNVNTATFGQLYTAYWAAMVDYSNRDNAAFPRPDGSFPPAGAAGTEFRQFFNPLRDPNEGTVGSPSSPTPDTEIKPLTPGAGVGRTARKFNLLTQRAGLATSETVKLRAALAAVNTLALRNPGDPSLPFAKVLLSGFVVEPTLGAHTLVNIEATVFGSKPQPYIVQVYAENDNNTTQPPGGPPTQANPQGYVGIELYNPYPFSIDLTNCQLGILAGRDRTALTGAGAPQYPNMKVFPLTFGTGVGAVKFDGFKVGVPANNPAPVIPPNGYLILENLPPPLPLSTTPGPGLNPANDAVYRPTIVDAPTSASLVYYYVPNLSMVMRDPANLMVQPGGELVLLRPRSASFDGLGNLSFGLPTVGPDYNETNLYDMAPMDSFDFSGLNLTATPATNPKNGVYYHRNNNGGTAVVGASLSNWKFVYPGRWDASQPWQAASGLNPIRQEGAEWGEWDTSANPAGTDLTGFPGTGPVVPHVWGKFPTPAEQLIPTYLNNFPPIQVASYGMAGPFKVTNGTAPNFNEFPFGGFARNGDILQVPYFGAYRLRALQAPAPYFTTGATAGTPQFPPGHTADMVLELNSLTMDCQQADDYDTYAPTGNISDDTRENIGRFCPIDGWDIFGVPPPLPITSPLAYDDLYPFNANPTKNPPFWRYHWAMQILDYLTVQCPQDEQSPAAPPEAFLKFCSLPNSANPFVPDPIPVSHSPGFTAAAAQTYGIVATTATTTSMTADVGWINVPAPVIPYTLQFLTGPNAGTIVLISAPTPVSGKTGQWNVSFTTLPVAPNIGDVFVIYGRVEPTASVNGLVNVNSANLRVLAAVPFVPNPDPNTNSSGSLLNTSIAYSIVHYRDVDDRTGSGHGHGPFKNLFELNRVPIFDIVTGAPKGLFRDLIGSALTTTTTDQIGDITPYPNSAGNPNTVGDFEGNFLMMNRISNLLTTRSDSFTAYILLEGWQDAETANPKLVVRRRAAYIIDRSGVTPTNASPTLTNIPTGN